MNRAYLGNNVYAEYIGAQIKLTTETDTIYMDHAVFLFGLLRFAEQALDIKIKIESKTPLRYDKLKAIE